MWGLSDEQRRGLILSVGSHRDSRPMSPVEVGQALQTAVTNGASREELASFLHLEGTTMVARFVRLVSLAPDIRHVVDWGAGDSTISFTAAVEIARLPLSDHRNAVESVLANDLSTAEVKQMVQLRQRSDLPLEECVVAVTRQRAEVVRRHHFLGAIRPELTESLTSIPQAERDGLLRDVVDELAPSAGSFGARLGTTRFSVVGGDEVARALRAVSGGDFERAVNDQLARRTRPIV